jgi:hypothetical protein
MTKRRTKKREETIRRKAATLRTPQPRRALRRTIPQTVETADERTAASVADATEIFDVVVDVDSREFAKLGDALRAVQLQLGRASLVLDGQVPSLDNADERARRGAEILAAMTAGTCSVEGILTLVALFDYHRLRARQLARRSGRAA